MSAPVLTRRGFTLLEVLLAVSILSMIGMLIFGSFDGLSRSKKSISQANQRYHQGRTALSRLSRELQSAYQSLHASPRTLGSERVTGLLGKDGNPADRLHFTSMAHLVTVQSAHESDQAELGYFGASDPDVSGKTDLVRRESTLIDDKLDRGGVTQVVAEDIESFELKYLDPVSREWKDSWDSTQTTAEGGRLPLQVLVKLVLNGAHEGASPIVLQERISLAMQVPLSFGALP